MCVCVHERMNECVCVMCMYEQRRSERMCVCVCERERECMNV